MQKNTMTVEAIENGTVLDHIPAGKGLAVLHYFRPDADGRRVTVGFNLASHNTDGRKDLIKIENIHFNDAQAALLALFAPEVTVNVIENFQVVKKIRPTLPETVSGIFTCPNDNCASKGEPVASEFSVRAGTVQPKLKCAFCEKTYPLDWILRGQ